MLRLQLEPPPPRLHDLRQHIAQLQEQQVEIGFEGQQRFVIAVPAGDGLVDHAVFCVGPAHVWCSGALPIDLGDATLKPCLACREAYDGRARAARVLGGLRRHGF